MKKTGVFYGSSTGTCEELANQIAEKLGVSSTDVHSVDKMTADKIKEYEVPSQLVGSRDLYKPRHKLTRNGERHNTKSPTCRYFTFSGKAFTLQQTI